MSETVGRFEFDELRGRFEKHLEDTEQGYDRLRELEEEVGALNAELKGDRETGRMSLRQDLTATIERNSNEFKKAIAENARVVETQMKIIKRIAIGVAIAILAGVIKVVLFSTLSLPWR